MLQAEQVLQERYQLQRKLGRTAAGRQTWLAKDLQSNEQVTLKLLAFNPQMQWEELKLFEREAQVLQSLNHPRIPRYRNYFSLNQETGFGLPWFGLVQDYIPGFSLQELLEQGKRFTEKQVRGIAEDVLQILSYLHTLNPTVLHRDIKPSNLIWGDDAQIYLVDFGAVQAQAAVTGVTFTVVGTGGYAPLEQFWGRAVPSSDLYALGATLIHLLTGTNPADLPHKESRIQFSDRVSISPSFVSWIETMTEIASEKRYSSAQQAMQSLKSGLVHHREATQRPVRKKIAKPAGTYIKLNQSADYLKITIPAPGFRTFYRKIGFFGFFLCLSLGLLLVIASNVVVMQSMVVQGTLLSFVLGLVTLIALLFPGVIFLATLFCERTHLSFNPQVLEIERQTWNYRYGRRKIDITNILGLFLQKEGNAYQINLRSYDGNYWLGGALGENEGIWLTQEIQNWLNSK